MTTTHPLAWPDGWPRTDLAHQIDGRYHFRRASRNLTGYGSPSRPWTFAEARDALILEVQRLGGKQVVLSSNFPTGRDGLPNDRARRPDDQGIAVYFLLGARQVVMARDAYQRAEENMRSLALAVEALRQLERHGGGHMMERAFQGFLAIAAPERWHDVLGVPATASEDEIERAFRTKAKRAHPDAGGSTAAMAALNAARAQGLAARG